MAEMKMLPIGVEGFQDIRTRGYYYVDKTGFIKSLMDNLAQVTLITRPRRFGKSLNVDMLKSFFEIGADPALFKGLKISEYPHFCEKYLGKYPVISVSLKDVEGSNFSDAVDMLGNVINREALEFLWLMDSPKLAAYEKNMFEKLLAGNFDKISVLTGSLELLSRLLYRHYGTKTVILIDEYDVPLDKAYQNGYYSEMVDLIRALFSPALKTNKSLEFAVITGCLRIAKESIFTGMNNFCVRSISDVIYDEYFGFTDEEVREMLRYYQIEDSYQELKEWYDGYHFGNTQVYCPWDVINQCAKRRVDPKAPMESYWANSSGNAIVQSILEDSTAETRDQMEILISGGSIRQAVMPELTYSDLSSEDVETRQTYLWSVLFATGYLTEAGAAAGRIHELAIPNREVREIYMQKIQSWFKVKVRKQESSWNELMSAIQTGEPEVFTDVMNRIMADSISIRDTYVRKEYKENFYHGMLLGLLRANGDWVVKSNLESGIGYTDILIKIPRERIGCVMEVKYAGNGNFESSCEEAMEQVERMDYAAVLRETGMEVIYIYGIAFYKKYCQVICKKE